MRDASRTLDALCSACQSERDAFRRTGEVRSPACVELFRHAFAADQEAWQAIYAIFQLHVAGLARQIVNNRLVDIVMEPEEIAQEAFAAFARFAPKQQGLVASDHLGPIISYLQHCVKSAVGTVARKAQSPPYQYHDERIDVGPSYTIDEDRDARQALYRRVFELALTEEEQIVALTRFIGNRKPQDIQREWPALFSDETSIYTVVQRLMRRFRKDPTIQQLCDDLAPGLRRKREADAFLQMSDENLPPEQSSMDAPCEITEAQLLDYITATASVELRVAVDRSPACRAAAQVLSEALSPLMAVLYRLECPSTDTLTSYQERSLGSTEQLVIRRHVQACTLCQREVALFDAIDALPVSSRGVMRRIIEAVFVGTLQAAPQLRGSGGVLRYRTPQVAITLSLREGMGKPSTWTLRCELRTPEGVLARGLLESADITRLDQHDTNAQQAIIDASGAFVFARLVPGRYRLRLLTPEEEIVIRDLAIADDE